MGTLRAHNTVSDGLPRRLVVNSSSSGLPHAEDAKSAEGAEIGRPGAEREEGVASPAITWLQPTAFHHSSRPQQMRNGSQTVRKVGAFVLLSETHA